MHFGGCNVGREKPALLPALWNEKNPDKRAALFRAGVIAMHTPKMAIVVYARVFVYPVTVRALEMQKVEHEPHPPNKDATTHGDQPFRYSR